MKSFLGDFENMILRLEDIIHGRDFQLITYRHYLSDGKDYLVGTCKYIDGNLLSLDGETYSLKDPILKYEITNEDKLTVWVE